jgi:hypothetical protein
VPRLVRHAFSEISSFDGTVPATIGKLVRWPGQLTVDYLGGSRRPYVSPFQLYALISILFFVIQPHTKLFGYDYALYAQPNVLFGVSSRMIHGELARTHIQESSYARAFNSRLAAHKQFQMFFLIPLFAVGLLALAPRRSFVTHLVFATHFVTMMLLYMALFLLADRFVFLPLLRSLPKSVFGGWHMNGDLSVVVFILLPLSVYLAIAAKRVYGGGRIGNSLRALGLLGWLLILTGVIYRTALFFTTFYSLRL